MAEAMIAATDDPRLAEARRLGRAGRPADALALARQVAATADPEIRLAALLRSAWHHLQLGGAIDGLNDAVAARKLAEDLGNEDRLAAAYSLTAWLMLELGVTDDAYAEACAAVALAERAGEPLTLAHALNSKGMALVYAQHPRLAEQHFRWAVKVAAEIGDLSALSLFLSNLAYAFADLGDESERSGDAEAAASHRDLAIDIGAEAIATATRAGDGWMLRLALTNTVEYLGANGHPEMARTLFEQWADAPGVPGARETIHHLYTGGELLMREGNLSGAQAACSEALALAERHGHTDHQMNCLRRLAEIAERQGRSETALDTFKRYHETYRRNEGEQARRRAEAAEIRFASEHHRAEAERLAAEVLLDPLTGIANRRAFEQRLLELGGAPFAVAMIDIDRFKTINDRHSHMLGDEVLRRVAGLLEAACTDGMMTARLGGEEFVLLFANPGGAETLCEQVRLSVEGFAWDELAPGLAVTISLGLSERIGDEPAEVVLARADRCLYAAKADGRNRVVAAERAEGAEAS
jgi:diguanylate cyclase (GGDEF)-like protein